MADPKINAIYQKIEREKLLIDAALQMRPSSNAQVQQSLDAQIKEARKNLSYLEQRLQEHEAKRMEQSMKGMNINQQGGDRQAGGGPGYGQQRNDAYGGPSSIPPKGGHDYGAYGVSGLGQDYQDALGAGSGTMPSRGPFGPQAPNSSIPKTRPNYSKLGTTDSHVVARNQKLTQSQI